MGAPNKLLIDNGGEIDNSEYIAAMEKYRIEVCPTGVSSPWSNGTCEINHATFDLMVSKMLEESPRMNVEIALAYAVSAKNSLQTTMGFHQYSW